jgi:DnaJ-class molecular chaperone
VKSAARRTFGVLALLVALGAFAVTSGRVVTAQQAPAPQSPSCKFCQSTGREPCTEHPRSECESEDEVLFCSFIQACPVCAGTGWIVCHECKSEVFQAALEKKKAEIAKHKIATEGLDKKVNRPLTKVETKHFILVFEVERIKVDKKFLNHHEGMHLYAKRLEQLLSRAR